MKFISGIKGATICFLCGGGQEGDSGPGYFVRL